MVQVAEGDYAFMNSEAALKYLISAKYTNQYRQAYRIIHILAAQKWFTYACSNLLSSPNTKYMFISAKYTNQYRLAYRIINIYSPPNRFT